MRPTPPPPVFTLPPAPRGPWRALEPHYRPRLTYALVFAIVVVFLAQLRDPTLIARYSVIADRVKAGDLYLIFTGAFLHMGILHIAMNAYFAWFAGARLEAFIGPWRLALVSLASLLASGAAIVAVDQNAAGFSGVLFGWLGAWLAFHLTRGFPGLRLSGPQRTAFLQVLLGNILLTIAFRKNISMPAHFGGLAGGFLTALLLGATRRPDED